MRTIQRTGAMRLMRPNATTMPSGTAPISVNAKICRLTRKPSVSMVSMVANDTLFVLSRGRGPR